MKRFKTKLLAAAFCAAVLPAVAADFDGSKPLICSSIEAHDCELGVTCLRKVAEDLNVIASRHYFAPLAPWLACKVATPIA